MDTLGVDENGYPVIIEYKRDRSESVINQGLFYLDWLMDHRGDFELLVRNTYGKEQADQIEWSAPRLICIASDFTKYDTHADKQMGRNIELIRYRKFGEDLLLLELLTAVSATPGPPASTGQTSTSEPRHHRTKSVSEAFGDADEALIELYTDLENYLLGLGDDVTKKTLRLYFAFRRIKNFACVEVKTSLNVLREFLKIDPNSIELEEGFTRDVSKIGHYGTGDLEVTITSHDDLEKAKPLLLRSYEAS